MEEQKEGGRREGGREEGEEWRREGGMEEQKGGKGGRKAEGKLSQCYSCCSLSYHNQNHSNNWAMKAILIVLTT